jgi:L-histidine N-alpha-methyltransferase
MSSVDSLISVLNEANLKDDTIIDNMIDNMDKGRIPYYYLYDDMGSELFDEITRLDEYYPYRREEELLKKRVKDIINDSIMGVEEVYNNKIILVEFGAGYSIKTDIILDELLGRYSEVIFIPIDVSRSACEKTVERYNKKIGVKVRPYVGTYDEYKREKRRYEEKVIYIWLGSSIGNMDESERNVFTREISEIMTYRDNIIIGYDSNKKDKEIIRSAYNDSKGVTEKFILNILSHIKRRFEICLEEEDYVYEVEWNEEKSRIEMYIKTIRDTKIRDKKNREIIKKKGEKILVEYSHKFSEDQIKRDSEKSDLMIKNIWETEDKYYMLVMFVKSVPNILNND